MLISFFQSVGLNRQNLITSFVTLLRIPRNKWRCRKGSCQRSFFFLQRKRNLQIICIIIGNKGIHSPSLHAESVNIHIPVDRLIFKSFCLCQHSTVFRNDVMTAKHKVLSGFSLPCAGINITRDQLCACRFHQKFSVSVLSYGLIGCRQVYKERSSRFCMGNRRRIGNPDILADLTTYRKTVHSVCLKQDMTSERNFFSFKIHHNRFFISRKKMARLIKLTVRRNKHFGNKSKDFTVRQSRSHIVKLALSLKGKSHKDKGILSSCLLRNPFKLLPAGKKKCFLQKKIVAGITADTKLGKHKNLCSCTNRFPDFFTNLICIVNRICHPDIRCYGSHL